MKSLFFGFLLFIGSIFAKDVDLIIFSYNRPLQLYALLESIEKRVTGVDNVFVLCRMDPNFQEGYGIVQKDFPKVKFSFQPNSKREAFKSFKPMMLNVLTDVSESKYILFAVDDIVVVDDIDLDVGKEFLRENLRIYGFYYRLGKNIDRQDFTAPGFSGVPSMIDYGNDIFTWKFKEGRIDWNYPNTVDFTLFRKSEVARVLTKLPFYNPNTLEAQWNRFHPQNGVGACHSHSKIVNIPMNQVNTSWTLTTIGNYTVDELYSIFLEGKKMDIFSIDASQVHSPHQDVIFEFIER